MATEDYLDRAGLKVAAQLATFISEKALPGTGIDEGHFWEGAARIFATFAPENAALLAMRDTMQQQIDGWHDSRTGQAHDAAAYRAMLDSIGYLKPEPEPFTIDPHNVDPELKIAGPQLVVPALNARFVVKAANARWGSLYDAFYGTDAIPGSAASGGYDPLRGALVIARVKAFLDETTPLADGKWADAQALRVRDGALLPALRQSAQFAGYKGDPDAPSAVLLSHNGLHIELVIDRTDAIGRDDPAGIADVILESALSTIVDLEDSVAAVDAADKVEGYANWLALMRCELTASFAKGGQAMDRAMDNDREYQDAHGHRFVLPGRSLLLVRNVGHLMTTPAVLLPDGGKAPEGLLDALVTTLCAVHDLKRLGRLRNSRTGSIYIVKPKMHGPDEAAFTSRLFDAVEDLLGLERHTVKIGLMDEERRTSANLAACIHALRHRIMFINTGFLDRTGDEIHTSMHAGPMIAKTAMKGSRWIAAYEQRNVTIGLSCGFAGRAQIGKGMWAQPDNMAAMLEAKIGHPTSGANTAWVPSPTAATLHALHYHAVNVADRQDALAQDRAEPLDALLAIPLADGARWSPDTVAAELRNSAQGILGYVVRWVDQGIGCSKVPDIHDIGLMEDRATLRISSQHIANWLRHGVTTRAKVETIFAEMAAKVDAQNAGDPLYRPMAGHPESLAWQAALALVFEGEAQPSGYTEPLLHSFRARVKAAPVPA